MPIDSPPGRILAVERQTRHCRKSWLDPCRSKGLVARCDDRSRSRSCHIPPNPGARRTVMFSIRFNRWTIAAFAPPLPCSRFAWFAAGADARSSGRQFGASFPPAIDMKSLTDLRQLPGRPSCQRRARRQFGGGVLSLGAAHRSEEQRIARSRLHFVARRWRYRRGREARRPHPDHRQIQPGGPPGGRRARPQGEEIRQRTAQHQPVDSRADHRSGRDAAVGLGQLRRRRHQDRGRQYRQADRPGMVSDLQGHALRHDP